jgi:phosphatidate cytidylyltransferase
MNEFFSRSFTWALFVVTFGGAYLHSSLLFVLLLAVIFLIVLCREWPKLVPFSGFEGVLFSLLYPGLPMVGLLLLHCFYYPADFYLSIYPFLIAWMADTCGYLIGKVCGRTKVCPSISPGKSWEGLAGSLVGVFVVNWFILPKIEAPFAQAAFVSYGMIGLLSMALTAVAFVGGMFVSKMKRAKNLKDTGNVLPGHGGFLDRFDSVFAVVLVVWVLLVAPSLWAKVKVVSTTPASTVHSMVRK